MVLAILSLQLQADNPIKLAVIKLIKTGTAKYFHKPKVLISPNALAYAFMPLKIFCTMGYCFTLSNTPTHFCADAFAQFSLFFVLFDSFFAINQ